MTTIQTIQRSPAFAARLLIGAVLAIGTVSVASAQTLPCDIYASAGTACVAAHSTTRALFGTYSGRLYQVKRASDGATTDIRTLTAGGYANAPAQDAFRPLSFSRSPIPKCKELHWCAICERSLLRARRRAQHTLPYKVHPAT